MYPWLQTHYVARDDLQFLISLPLSLEFEWRYAPQDLAYVMWRWNLRLLHAQKALCQLSCTLVSI